MLRLSIVMPAYNEEKRIGKTLYEYSKFFENLRKDGKLDYEMLVVINNTQDRTEEIVRRYQEKNRRIRFLNLEKGGKGYAVIEGFKDALKRPNKLIGFVDSDMATPPEEYFKLTQSLGEEDGAIADRYLKDSKISPPATIQRILARKLFNFVIRSMLFLPHDDTQCGAKVFKRRAIEAALSDLTMSKWAFDVDLLYTIRKKGYRIKSLPTIWIDREYSKINFWSAGPWMVLGVLRLRLLNSPFKDFIRIYNKLLKRVWRMK